MDRLYSFGPGLAEGMCVTQQVDEEGKEHFLNRYWTEATYPRPESYKEDMTSSLGAVSRVGLLTHTVMPILILSGLLSSIFSHNVFDQPKVAELYGGIFANIAAGAESGWDFSSRWIVPGEVSL